MLDAPLTWGQQDIWRAVEGARPQEQYLNIARVFDAPKRPVTVDRALLAIGRLVARHEALRTRMGHDLRQVVHESADPPIELVTEPAQQAADRLAATSFRYFEEWPIKVALTVDGGYVRQFAIVLCHLAADGHAADLIVRDLRLLLIRDALPAATSVTPRELAAWQHSEEGRRVCGAALDFWLSEYRRMDPIGPLGGPAGEPRFREATMRSTALAVASQAVAARDGVSSSTVLLAAAVRLAGGLTGQRHCGMRVIVNNRHTLPDVVSTVSQEALVVLDLKDPDPYRHAWSAAVRAYRQARYDPYAMEAMVAPMGPEIRSFGCFNDQRLVHRDAPLDVPAQPTELAWTDVMDRNVCDFRLHIGGEPDRMEVSLYADTALLAPPGIEAYLLGLESLLVEEAAR